MMSRQTAKEVVVLMWTCCAVAYPFYAWITDTGLFRWFVDLELTLPGNGVAEGWRNICRFYRHAVNS